MSQILRSNLRKEAKKAAVYQKAKIPLKGFEFVENVGDAPVGDITKRPIIKKEIGILPNAKFQYMDDLKTYNSYQAYVDEATKARYRYNEDKTEGWWLTVNQFYQDNFMPNSIYVNKGHDTNVSPGMPTLGQRIRAVGTKKLEIINKLKLDQPISTSGIKNLIDLDKLSAVDNKLATIHSAGNGETGSKKKLTSNPDKLLTGHFIENHVTNILSHHDIFKSLEIARFTPRENVLINFGPQPCLYGNRIYDSSVFTEQNLNINFEGYGDKISKESKDSYTVGMVSLDSGLVKETQYINYLQVYGGENHGTNLVKFLPPFPARGAGYHRVVFLVWKNLDIEFFRQNLKTGSTETEKLLKNEFNLRSRDIGMKNLRLFKKQQDAEKLEDHLVAIRLINTRWDKNTSQVFTNLLKIKEPVFGPSSLLHKTLNTFKGGLTSLTEGHKPIQKIHEMLPYDQIFPGMGIPEGSQVSKYNDKFRGEGYRYRQEGK